MTHSKRPPVLVTVPSGASLVAISPDARIRVREPPLQAAEGQPLVAAVVQIAVAADGSARVRHVSVRRRHAGEKLVAGSASRWPGCVVAEMPTAEHDVDLQLVAGLLADQHPDLANLPLRHLAHGWDNESYRLGDEMVVRLPRRQAAAELIVHEQRWLGELARMVRLPIPAPLRIGLPGRGYPWSWSIVPWLNGDCWEASPPVDVEQAATDLGAFLSQLHRPAPLDAPRNPVRGVPLADRTGRFENGLSLLGDRVDADRCRGVFNRLVTRSPWTAPPVWMHGDLHPLNLLVADGRLSAVIDWGDLCAGDPASDVSVAWMVLPAGAHPTFRRAAGTDEPIDGDTWARARGWALALSIAILASSDDNPTMAGIGTRALHAVLESSD